MRSATLVAERPSTALGTPFSFEMPSARFRLARREPVPVASPAVTAPVRLSLTEVAPGYLAEREEAERIEQGHQRRVEEKARRVLEKRLAAQRAAERAAERSAGRAAQVPTFRTD